MKTLVLAITFILSATAAAQSTDVKVPKDVEPFIEKGAKAIALKSADFNNDGRKDFLLVFERPAAEGSENDMPETQRPLLILVREKDGSLKEAKRNERIVLCSTCGGVFGDPFADIAVGPGTFTVEHYGGSAWRWTNSARFNYSRIDKTWQLVRYESTSFHTANPNKTTRKIKLPKHFGKVDIADFDPANFDS